MVEDDHGVAVVGHSMDFDMIDMLVDGHVRRVEQEKDGKTKTHKHRRSKTHNSP